MIPPVIVTGTGRSGTTTVARLLHEELGVAMAPSSNLFGRGGPGSEAGGTYEDVEVRRIHIEMHRGELTLPQMREEMLELAGVRSGHPWGWKDPRAAHVLGLHLQWFPGAVVVWCQRHVGDVAGSIHRWYGTSLPKALDETLDRWRQLHALLHHRLNVYPLSFDRRRSDEELLDELRAIGIGTPHHADCHSGGSFQPGSPAGHARDRLSGSGSGVK